MFVQPYDNDIDVLVNFALQITANRNDSNRFIINSQIMLNIYSTP